MPRQPGTFAASRDRTVSYHRLNAGSSSGLMVALTTKRAGRVVMRSPPRGLCHGLRLTASGGRGYKSRHLTGFLGEAPMRSPPWVRPLGAVLVLAFLLVPPASSPAPAADGQMTWAVHVTIAPAWFDPGEHPGIVTTMMIFYALHDPLVEPGPRN